ncbi:MAG TPA: class I SAM-dependent methyltransferase [Candidatus Methylomirabilis sp.]|nr:class I SAM-dependent methyltransferase [Candidatus Methylomirabilis sp.]
MQVWMRSDGLQILSRFKHHVAMPRYNQKEKIRDHYDRVSPYYISLWGQHLHHGYWIRGDETKEEAQVQMVEHLARAAGVPRQCKLLDIGCGFGGSSLHLAKKYGVQATGITISPVQVEMANAAAKKAGAKAEFLLMDAEAMKFKDPFDVLWSIESISHYQDHDRFFASAARLLKAGGTLAITDWFKKEGLTAREYKKALEPIEKGMLVELRTMEAYESFMNTNGLQVVRKEILNEQCAKTWDLCLDMIKKKELWAIAAKNGVAFVHYLKAFKAMRAGFASGSFVYGLMVATKPAAN